MGSAKLLGYAPVGVRELGGGERAVLGLPLGDSREAVSDGKGGPGRLRHPGRDAHVVLRSGIADPLMDIRVHGDRELG
ncbi:MAG: hypothetical protein JO181_10465 [Solirubrobacterales bacterium]|nr:hypothetical protein [Solirubrobacterales bacterium]